MSQREGIYIVLHEIMEEPINQSHVDEMKKQLRKLIAVSGITADYINKHLGGLKQCSTYSNEIKALQI